MRACSSLVGTIRKCKYLAFTVCPPQWQQSHQHSVLKKKVQYLFWLPGPSFTRAPCTAGFRMEPRFALLAFWLPTAHVLQVNNPLASTPSDWHSRKKSMVWVQGAHLIHAWICAGDCCAVRIDALDKVCEYSLWTCKHYRTERCYCCYYLPHALVPLRSFCSPCHLPSMLPDELHRHLTHSNWAWFAFSAPAALDSVAWITWYLRL